MAQRPRRSPIQRGLLLGLIVLLHLALWWLPITQTLAPAPTPQKGLSISLRLLPLVPPKRAVVSASAGLSGPPARPDARPARPALKTAPADPDTRWQAQAKPITPIALVEPADQPASTPPGSARQLLDSAATQQAIRAATRAPLLSERADAAAQAPERTQASARLGQQIQRAGHGDCLKGEFAGAGAGLLSLPFWALAEATGKCRK